jgi:hypothetical protein
VHELDQYSTYGFGISIHKHFHTFDCVIFYGMEMNYSSLILFSSAQNYIYIYMRFVRGSPCSVLLAFSQSYVKYDLKKKKNWNTVFLLIN